MCWLVKWCIYIDYRKVDNLYRLLFKCIKNFVFLYMLVFICLFLEENYIYVVVIIIGNKCGVYWK